MSVHNIKDFGAAGDGSFDNTAAIEAAIEACGRDGGGTVYVPAGIFLTGRIELISRMTLYVEAGAVLKFTDRFEAYPPAATRWSGYECFGYSPLIFGRGLERVTIKGEGIIDGQGQEWWSAYREIRSGGSPQQPYGLQLAEHNRELLQTVSSNIVEWRSQFLRPPLLQLLDCTQVTIEGVTLQNSPFWNTHLVYCDRVSVQGVTFLNPSDAPNGDGLDIDSCTNVNVSGCYFDVGDDCLCLKAGIDEDGRRVGRATENVVVTGCLMKNGHGGIVMGSETAGGIRHVVVTGCIFNGTDRGIRIKTNRARGGGVEDIRVSGIFMRDVLCPIAVNAFYRHGIDERNSRLADPGPIEIYAGTPVVKGLYLSDITARNARAAAAFLYGLPEMPLQDIVLRNIVIEMTDDPEEPGGEPDMVREKITMAGAGMYVKHVRGLVLDAVRIEPRQGPPLTLEDADDARTDGLDCRSLQPNIDLAHWTK